MDLFPTSVTGWLWWAAGLLLVVSALAAAAWLARTRPWRGARPRHPVVLIHGIMGFAEIGIGSYRQAYFRAIPQRLESLGIKVYRPRLPALGSVAERAEILARALREIPAARVNLIAHSMGGLDARWAISRLGCASKVASLTTIGTPHRGTPVADVGSGLVDAFLRPLLSRAGLGLDAVRDLTTRKAEAFNKEVPDARRVRYACVVATTDQPATGLHPVLKPIRAWLNGRSGPSDGLVPISSQVWGEVLERVQADHWAQIGWSSGFDAPALYERICTQLRRRGL